MIKPDNSSQTSPQQIYDFAAQIFPIARSITGNGVRQTLAMIKQHLPGLEVFEIPSGTQAFDWQIPDEWNITDAYIMDESGRKVVDWQTNNLHVVSYSTPVNEIMSLDELDKHLHSLPEQPDAIPYVTSYYKPCWGFCLSHTLRQQLKNGSYRVVIDSQLKPGSLTYGELMIPGEEASEILLSTYVCHPSMANNECSGPAVTTFLAKWLLEQPRRRHTYRIVFIPETIGSIVYLSRNLEQMQRNIIAGFVVTCVGDNRDYSFMPSRLANTLADKVALHILRNHTEKFTPCSFLERGSDERQYCSPLVNLPVVSIMRSKYGKYPEYHTSLDNLSLISPEGLSGACELLKKCLIALEQNCIYTATTFCEPQLGKRNLYPTLSARGSVGAQTLLMRDILAYSDGKLDLIDIAGILGVSIEECCSIVELLLTHGLLKRVAASQN
ncbi:MAG: aminopeptidase [Candidatus Riflebacteria bacterium GWC2_50_8]|nr:MAG: aminopeptidase [Candidatus Riflebacteria bacterium GWC2_50_8]